MAGDTIYWDGEANDPKCLPESLCPESKRAGRALIAERRMGLEIIAAAKQRKAAAQGMSSVSSTAPQQQG